MPQFMVAIIVLAILVLGAIGVAGLYGLTRALTRWTTETGRQNISVRLAAASVTAMLVFLLTYLSAWAALRQVVTTGEPNGYWVFRTKKDFLRIHEALSDFSRKYGHYPDSLDELEEFKNRQPDDSWGRPYHYTKTESGFRLLSLGRDGKPGGSGLDADIEPAADMSIDIEPTLSQFLFEAAGSGSLFGVALIASLCAGLVCILSSAPMPGRRVGVRNLLWPVLWTTVVALGVAFFLVMIYSIGEYH